MSNGRVDRDSRTTIIGPQHIWREHIVIIHNRFNVSLTRINGLGTLVSQDLDVVKTDFTRRTNAVLPYVSCLPLHLRKKLSPKHASEFQSHLMQKLPPGALPPPQLQPWRHSPHVHKVCTVPYLHTHAHTHTRTRTGAVSSPCDGSTTQPLNWDCSAHTNRTHFPGIFPPQSTGPFSPWALKQFVKYCWLCGYLTFLTTYTLHTLAETTLCR